MDNKLICFVIMGYGPRVDYATGRSINLDKTYENLIKPVFKKLKIDCFRAIDHKHSGTIDTPMYKFIQKADIVVADISTLNPNAMYELGVRHALRPNTTIVIAEKGLIFPFDINHTVIRKYEHLGDDIGVTEAKRFTKELLQLVKKLIETPEIDSPVYTFLPNLIPPSFTAKEIKELKEVSLEADTLSNILSNANRAIIEIDFKNAIEHLNAALEISPNDQFIKQQLALATIWNKIPTESDALDEAEFILNSLNPERTTDTETLGLLGAVYKRKHSLTKNPTELSKAIEYYGKGFIIAKDYYNGVNLALLLLKQSLLYNNLNDAIADIVWANRVYTQTEKYCNELLEDNFKERPDKVWILLTLAEVYYAKGDHTKSTSYLDKAKDLIEGKFELQSFETQIKTLDLVLEKINEIIAKFPNSV